MRMNELVDVEEEDEVLEGRGYAEVCPSWGIHASWWE
jgi:hypothetical protein